MLPPLISPSVLNADLANLGSEVQRIGEADLVHLDVMDNHFVPNLTFGLPVVKNLLGALLSPADVHLMIDDPDRWAPQYAEAGAASVTFHAEASQAPIRLARELRARGAKAGLALKPVTEIDGYLEYLDEFDMVLLMSVEPGFGGQRFLKQVLPKVRRTAEALAARSPQTRLQVDGGITRENIALAAAAGANVFVAGSAVFGAADPNAEIVALRDLAAAATS